MAFNVIDQKCIFDIDLSIYEIDVICKAAYQWIEEVYVYFDRIDEKTVRVFLESKEAVTDEELMIRGKQFSNELLVQKVRYGVSKQTKNVRELILGRALYSTCIETNEESEKSEDSIDEMEDIDMQADENISLDDIAVSWFEQYAGEEGHE